MVKNTLLFVCFVILVSCNQERLCVVENLSLNEVSPYYDGQWQGITIASDGACYFGSSSHNLIHGGGFFKFDPETNQLEVLSKDLTDLVGDDITKYTPQGKIHSPIIEIDGELFMATHLAAYWDEVLDKYAGSYLLSYNIHTQEWTNYGIPKTGFSTYSAIEVDSKRGKAYTMTVPFAPKDTVEGNRLFEIDLKTKQKRDLGRVGKGKASFHFFLDDLGKVWISMWRGEGSLHCYDPAADTIIEYKNAFPEARLLGKEETTALLDKKTPAPSWTWLQPIEDGKKCLFAMGGSGGGDERLWLFDPHKDISSKEAFQPICYIGNTFLSVALGGDRVYFIQRGDNKASRGYSTELMRDKPADSKGHHINDLHLRSVSLNPKDGYKIIDHGKLIDKDGRTAAYIGSLAADDKGNVYMSGGWLTKESDQATLQYIFKSSDGKSYGPLEGPGQDKTNGEHSYGESDGNFVKLNRGEFFSRVNVSKDF